MERICNVTDDVLRELVELASKAGPDTGVCPVDISWKIAAETMKNSCGKGVMCRDGIRQIYMILDDVVKGRGKPDDVELLKELTGVIRDCADCDLSYTAADTIVRLLTEFEDEFTQHVRRKSCRNLVCQGCHTVHINAALCKGHGVCISVCPQGAIKGGEGLFSVVKQARCNSCDLCISKCPEGAIKGAAAIKPQGPEEPGAVGSWGNAGAEGGGGRRRRRG